jgi:hypothetical protein
MATIYDIKIEGVSHWISYDEEDIKEKISKVLKQITLEEMISHKNEMEFPKIEVNIKA